MWRDRWFKVAVIGALLSCLACLTPVAVIALAAVELSAWAGRLDFVLVPVLFLFVVLAIYRYRVACRRAR
jgi:mercuric ion transport protein